MAQFVKFNRLKLKNKNAEISLLAVLGHGGIEIFEMRRSSEPTFVSLQTIEMHVSIYLTILHS